MTGMFVKAGHIVLDLVIAVLIISEVVHEDISSKNVSEPAAYIVGASAFKGSVLIVIGD